MIVLLFLHVFFVSLTFRCGHHRLHEDRRIVYLVAFLNSHQGKVHNFRQCILKDIDRNSRMQWHCNRNEKKKQTILRINLIVRYIYAIYSPKLFSGKRCCNKW